MMKSCFGFSGLSGRESLHGSLKERVALGNFSHAYIFSGSDGMGKQTLAHAFAAALLCESPIAGEPCGKCPSCKKCAAKTHPDLIILEGEGKTGAISVDAIRQLRSDAYIRPNEGNRKIYLLPHADSMQVPAQNALLKILEEPPPYAVILLLSENSGGLLATIRSRAVLVSLPPLSFTEVEELLNEHCPQLDLDEKKTALLLASGNPGLALSLADDPLLKETLELIEQVSKGLANQDLYFLLRLASQIGKNREVALSFSARFTALCGVALRHSEEATPSPVLSSLLRLTKGMLVHIIELLPDFTAGIYGNANLTLLSESFLIKCWRTPH